MNDHSATERERASENISKNSQDVRSAWLYSDLVAKHSDGHYNSDQFNLAINSIFGVNVGDVVKHSTDLIGTFACHQHVDVHSTDNDWGAPAILPTALTSTTNLITGLNPSAGTLSVRPDNDVTRGTMNAMNAAGVATDNDGDSAQRSMAVAARDEAVRELKAALKANQGIRGRGSSAQDNVDPTGFAFLIMARLNLHNTAVRYNREKSVLGVEEPTDATTMLSWPIASEYDGLTNSARGFGVSDDTTTDITPDNALNGAIAMMVSLKVPIVKYTVNSAAATVIYEPSTNDADINTLGAQLLVGSEPNQPIASFFVKRHNDGRVWLYTAAVNLFRAPALDVISPISKRAVGDVSYYLGNLNEYKGECQFLLGKSKLGRPMSPSIIGTLEDLCHKSYAVDQHIVLNFTDVEGGDVWRIHPRELATAALTLLRGSGVRKPAMLNACVIIGELVGATMLTSDSCMGVAPVAYTQQLPPIMCWAVQGFRLMGTSALMDPNDMGLAHDLVYMPNRLGVACDLASKLWLASLEQADQTFVDVPPAAGLQMTLETAAPSKVSALSELTLNLTKHSAIGEGQWRPAHAAASYIVARNGKDAQPLAAVMAEYGSNALRWKSGLTASITSTPLDGAYDRPGASMSVHVRHKELHYSGLAATLKWHTLPQESIVKEPAHEAIGEYHCVFVPRTRDSMKQVTKYSVNHDTTNVGVTTAYAVKIYHPNKLGTIEHALAAHLEASSLETHDLDERAALASGSGARQMNVPCAVINASMTPGYSAQYVTKNIGSMGDRYSLSGTIPAVVVGAVTKLLSGYQNAQGDSRPMCSAIGTSPEAIRNAANSGQLKFRCSAGVSLTYAKRAFMSPSIPLLSPWSSVHTTRLVNDNKQLVSMTPMHSTKTVNNWPIHNSTVQTTAGSYHKDNGTEDAGKPSRPRHTVGDYMVANAKRPGYKVSARFAMIRRPIVTYKEASKDEHVTHEVTPGGSAPLPERRVETQLIMASCGTVMLAQLLETGIPVNVQPMLLSTALDIAKAKGAIVPGVKAVTRTMNPFNPKGKASYGQFLEKLGDCGVVDGTFGSNASQMAAILISNYADPNPSDDLIDALNSTPVAAGMAELAKQIREIKSMNTPFNRDDLIKSQALAWLASADVFANKCVMRLINTIVSERGPEDELTCYSYAMYEDDEEFTDDVAKLAEMLVAKCEAAPDTYNYEEMTLTEPITELELATMPAVVIGSVVLTVGQVLGDHLSEETRKSAIYQDYLTAFSLNNQFQTGELADSSTLASRQILASDQPDGSDPTLCKFIKNPELHTALKHVAMTHLVYTGRLWAPCTKGLDLRDNLRKMYDQRYVPYMEANYGGSEGGYSDASNHVSEMQRMKLLIE
nr:putative capsid protein P1 [Cordyceps militaris quadrivirus 2]